MKQASKKELKHKKLTLNKIMYLPPSEEKNLKFSIKHAGKINHIIYLDFSVEQGGESVTSKIHVKVFTEKQLVDWFCDNQYVNCCNFFTNKSVHHESKTGEFQAKITDDNIIHVIMNNKYLSTISKNIHLNIVEEWDEEETMSNVIATIPTSDESLREGIEEMIRASKEKLMIISPYVDMTMIKKLIEKNDQGVKVQIILRSDKHITGLSKDAVTQIRKTLSQSYRIHNDVHSRLLIRDSIEVLVSSADLTQQSLQNQPNMGIRTSDPKIVSQSTEFFKKIWQESKTSKKSS